jgi:DNA-binding CsgD family transcriptional regulator
MNTRHSKGKTTLSGYQFAKTILNSISAHVAILDERGFILETNLAWKRFAKQNNLQMRPENQRVNYLEICDNANNIEGEKGVNVANGIRDVIVGKIEEFVLDYPCHSPDKERWFYMRVTRAAGAGPTRIVVSHENITELRQSEIRLRQKEAALNHEKVKLEEANTALKVLLRQHKIYQRELEATILDNVHRLIRPIINRLSDMNLQRSAAALIASLDDRLSSLTKPFLRRLSNIESILTPQEIEVAALIREGLGSKEIGKRLHLSLTTINFHRRNLRRKLNLRNTPTNLRTFLMNLHK